MENKFISIGSDRQLFVDDFWIEDSSGVTRHLHQPVRQEAAIIPEQPWETEMSAYNTVEDDSGIYRMWYRADYPSFSPTKTGDVTESLKYKMMHAYAESTDGITWNKPTIGLIDYQGSRNNNLVFDGPGDCFAPFIDRNPKADKSQKYKAVVRGTGRNTLEAWVSQDGFKWERLCDEPILSDPPFDSHNVAMWDEQKSEYVIYARGSSNTGGPFRNGVRWIRRSSSPDFINWTPLENISTGSSPYEHLYTNSCIQYKRAPGTYLMFPSRIVVDRTPQPDWPHGDGVNDIVFMSSRDGINFDRSFMEAFVRPGLDQRNWHERAIYMDLGILQTSPSQMSLYGMENGRYNSVNIRRYSLRSDGFVSVRAGYTGGEFTTKPFLFDGKALEINYSTSAVGFVKIEIQDIEGNPIPGYSMQESNELFGDQVDKIFSWRNGTDVSSLSNIPARLKFQIKDADLYAFRFMN